MYRFENENHNEEYFDEKIPFFHDNPKKNRKKSGILKKIIMVALSALMFGSVAGASFFGMNELLNSSEPSSSLTQDNYLSLTSSNSSVTAENSVILQSLDVSDIAAENLPSVVSVTNISVQQINTYFGMFGRNQRIPSQTTETVSCGSGIIVSSEEDGLYIVSNYHVIEGATSLSVTFITDETYEAEVCGYDEDIDLAVLRVRTSELSETTTENISVASLGDSEALVVGEQVVAIGNALGYGQSVTTGIVSAVDRILDEGASSVGYIQTDAAINPGNSGGALLNMEGELIGINTAKLSSTDIEGMGYAIPISQVKELIEKLIA